MIEAELGDTVNRTRIKICGITSSEDAQLAINAGADAIGLVFWEPSKRAVTIEQAQTICAQIPPFISVVALVVDAETKFIDKLLESVPVDLLQFHGNESPQQCRQYGRRFLKAIRMRPDINIATEIDRYQTANGILLDAYRKGIPGGTGESFDWKRIPSQYRNKIVLAGGLNHHNVASAVTSVRPYAVDVSGGVELSAGVKDAVKIRQFVQQVREADSVK